MRTPQHLLTCVALLTALSAASLAHADERTWVGRSFFNNNWSDVANWDLFTKPASGDVPLFTPAGSRLAPFVDVGFSINGMRFRNDPFFAAPAYTINGSATLTLRGSISNESTTAQRVNAPIRLSAPASFSNFTPSSGRLTIGGPVNNNGHELFPFTGTAGIAVLGFISGAGPLTKQGSGTLDLTAGNTYTGDTTITNGTLRLSGNGRLADATDLRVAGGAVFELTGITDAVNSLNGNLGTSGTVRLAGNATLVVGVNGAPSGAGDFTGVIQGNGSLIKRGTANLVLSGANTYTGATTVEQGTLRLLADAQLSELTNVTIASAGVLDLVSAGVVVNNLSGAGTLNMTTLARFIAHGGNFTGSIQGDGGITKRGAGTLVLSGHASHSGNTAVTEGALTVTPSAVSPNSPVVVIAGLYLLSGAPGTYAPSSLEIRSVGAVRLAAGRDKLLRTSNVTITGAGHLDLADNALALTAGNLHAVSTLIASARNGGGSGRWTGPGITSSAAADNPLTTLAIGLAGNDVIVKHTYNGDANIDGLINADDYFRIDQGFLAQPSDPLFSQGDFNYDGKINADDYFLIDQAFLGQGAPLGSSPGLLSSAPVPEPGIAIATLGAACLLLRRSRV